MTLRDRNAARWAAIKIVPSRQEELEKTAEKLLSNKPRYEAIEAAVKEQSKPDAEYYVPWWFIAIVHIREADGAFDRQLSQGDHLDRVSIHEPKGRGPFLDKPGEKYDAFTRGCFDALIDCPPHAAKSLDWTPGGALTMFEEYNGLGYANHGIASPYVWSGTNQYNKGKYVADGKFSAGTVDTQPGCAALLYLMEQRDNTIVFYGK